MFVFERSIYYMAVYSNGIETKKQLILQTYKQLQEKDASELRVRSIAQKSGCTASTLYGHFDSLEYLITVASIHFLSTYMKEYGKNLSSGAPEKKTYFEGWEIFNKHAFNRPDIFYRLFWGQYQDEFENALQEYFELFPFPGPEKHTAQFYLIYFNSNFQQRDFLLLRSLANQKLIKDDDAFYLSEINNLISKSLINEAIGKDRTTRKDMEQKCNELIFSSYERASIEKSPK